MILKKAHPRFRPFFQLMLKTGVSPCDMWNLTKNNFPGGDFLYIVQDKTDEELNVPIIVHRKSLHPSPIGYFPGQIKVGPENVMRCMVVLRSAMN